MRSAVFLISSLFCALTGCTSDGHHSGDDTGGESYNCEAETRDDEFVVGISKPGAQNQARFELMTAAPAPPTRGDNTWLLKLDVGGAPMTNATITVTPFMPDHQHGTPITVGVEAMPEAGQYNLTPINMWMPGLWETTITATGTEPSAIDDAVVFRFCIPS